MSNTLTLGQPTFLREVEARSGTLVSACLQCHKCASGCPVGTESDVTSSQVMRMIHLGLEDEVLGSRAIWLCASCAACTARCPQGIDIAGVMDALRILAVERAAALGDTHGKAFRRSFLASVRRHGRVYEVGMMMAYKLRTGHLFADADKAPRMLAKGKLPLLPNRSGSAKAVRDAFRRAQEEDKQP
jgi:heterodisulfide reductase subunit C